MSHSPWQGERKNAGEIDQFDVKGWVMSSISSRLPEILMHFQVDFMKPLSICIRPNENGSNYLTPSTVPISSRTDCFRTVSLKYYSQLNCSCVTIAVPSFTHADCAKLLGSTFSAQSGIQPEIIPVLELQSPLPQS